MPEIASLFLAGRIADLCGGEVIGNARAGFIAVSVDSRSTKPGDLFVALEGARLDGHAFIDAALASGAHCVLAERSKRALVRQGFSSGYMKTCAVILVDGVLKALHILAREHRSAFPKVRRVGITGSNGKTTTKECTVAIAKLFAPVVFNPGNLNSDIGLPQSLFLLQESHEVAIFEMGMNRPGELTELAWVYEPDIALITNTGTAHIGNFGTRAAIAQEKKQIFSCFSGFQKALVWEGDRNLDLLASDVKGLVEQFGIKTTHGLGKPRNLGLDGWDMQWQGKHFCMPLPGRHNLNNAIAAIAIAHNLGALPDHVAQGLESMTPLFGRMEILNVSVENKDIVVLQDCYNANPESMSEAINLAGSLKQAGRLVLVLGAMKELGKFSQISHTEVGEMAARSNASALFFFGEEARDSFEAAKNLEFKGLLAYETNMDTLGRMVRSFVQSGDHVLLKGSRSVELERVFPRGRNRKRAEEI